MKKDFLHILWPYFWWFFKVDCMLPKTRPALLWKIIKNGPYVKTGVDWTLKLGFLDPTFPKISPKLWRGKHSRTRRRLRGNVWNGHKFRNWKNEEKYLSFSSIWVPHRVSVTLLSLLHHYDEKEFIFGTRDHRIISSEF